MLRNGFGKAHLFHLTSKPSSEAVESVAIAFLERKSDGKVPTGEKYGTKLKLLKALSPLYPLNPSGVKITYSD